MDSAKTILIVDDDLLVRRSLARAISQPGFAVLTASCASQAIEFLEQQPIDAVISDHLMPGMNGLELLREVQKRFPACVRIMLTGFMPERVAEALASGEIDRFMTKPWVNAELRSALNDDLARRVKKAPAVPPDPQL